MRSTSSGTLPLVVLTAGRLVSSNALTLTEVGKGLEGIDHDCATCSHVCVSCRASFRWAGALTPLIYSRLPLSEVVVVLFSII